MFPSALTRFKPGAKGLEQSLLEFRRTELLELAPSLKIAGRLVHLVTLEERHHKFGRSALVNHPRYPGAYPSLVIQPLAVGIGFSLVGDAAERRGQGDGVKGSLSYSDADHRRLGAAARRGSQARRLARVGRPQDGPFRTPPANLGARKQPAALCGHPCGRVQTAAAPQIAVG